MIRVLVVDASPEVQSQISEALSPLPDAEVVGTVPASAAALERVAVLRPDVLLMSMDDDGAASLAEAISTRYPFVSLIMTSRNGEADQLRRAMQAGARQFLVKPLAAPELVESVRTVYRLDESRRTAALAAQSGPATVGVMAPPPRAATGPAREGKIFTFYSAKGGAGCTTLACNTAIALKRATGKEVALFDCGLLFGDVGVVLNLNPRSTIVDLLPQMDAHPGPLDPEFLSQTMIPHASGVKVLLAPASPEKAELVTAEHVHRVLIALRDQFDFVVIDTWPTFEERILNVLD
ncbi:MAG TPA: response regulator, partial [Chloroflexota bacterium]|nr:response regulator [Chloroflexota bacterium]